MIVQLRISIKRLRNSWTSSETVHLDPRSVPTRVYNVCMNKTTSNPYETYILSKGRDLPPVQPATRQVPARFADRFATYEEYQEAMADFLNGM